MRLAPGFRFYVRIFHYVADRRSIDVGMADHVSIVKSPSYE